MNSGYILVDMRGFNLSDQYGSFTAAQGQALFSDIRAKRKCGKQMLAVNLIYDGATLPTPVPITLITSGNNSAEIRIANYKITLSALSIKPTVVNTDPS